jgi:TonB family protein
MRHTISGLIAATCILLMIGWTLPGSVRAEEFQTLDKMPEPVGGMATIMNQVVYPATAKTDGIEGKVFVSVVVDVNGASKTVEVRKGVRQDLDQAAVKALEKVRWTPAEKNGKAIEMTVVVPIYFKLENKEKK